MGSGLKDLPEGISVTRAKDLGISGGMLSGSRARLSRERPGELRDHWLRFRHWAAGSVRRVPVGSK